MTILLITFIIGGYLFYLKQCGSLRVINEPHIQDMKNWVSTCRGSIHIETFTSDSLTVRPNLVLVVHGDAPFNKPDYQYKMAAKIAGNSKNTIAIGILRPGYSDPENNISSGLRGLTTGDNYTSEVISTIAEVISKLKSFYHPSKTVMVGHSGGSAITADLVSLNPGLINIAVLVSCPCDLPVWRRHMLKKQWANPYWLFPVNSISPMDVARKISDNMEIQIIVGGNDDVTPPYINKEYADWLKSLNKKEQYFVVPNQGHEILLDETVLNRILAILN